MASSSSSSSSSSSHVVHVGVLGMGAIGAYIAGNLLRFNHLDEETKRKALFESAPSASSATSSSSPSIPPPSPSSTSNIVVRVVMVGRRESVKAELVDHGLNITELSGDSHQLTSDEFEYSTDARILEGCHIILVAVKSFLTDKMGKVLSNLNLEAGAGSAPTVVSLQNGVRNAEVLRGHLPQWNVLASVVNFNVVRVDDCHYVRSTSGALFIENKTSSTGAALAPSSPSSSPRFPASASSSSSSSAASAAQYLANIPKGDLLCKLLSPFMEVSCCSKIEGLQWSKLLLNLTNSLNALAGIPLKPMLQDSLYRTILAEMMNEGLRVLAAAHIQPVALSLIKQPWFIPHVLRLPTFLYSIIAASTLRVSPTAKTSMATDLDLGQPTEIDSLNGEIVRLGQIYNVATPLNRFMREAVDKASIERKGSPGLSATQLAQQMNFTPPPLSLVSKSIIVLFLVVVVLVCMSMRSVFRGLLFR